MRNSFPLACLAFFALLSCASTLPIVSKAQQAASLELVDGTHCLDGSAAGYYLRKAGSAATDTKWVIFLQGGGYCGTQEDCTSRSQTKLGSSKTWSTTMTLEGVSSADSEENPDFFEYNSVFVPYCNGDVHSGQITTPSPETWGFYFSGHSNLVSIVADLIAKHDLGSATDVVFSGSSAGGIGVFINADALAEALPSANVVAFPQAGWFLPVPPFGPNAPGGGLVNVINSMYNRTQSFVDKSCAQKYPDTPQVCMSANFTFKEMTVPVFIAEHQYDTNQLFVQDGVPSKFDASTCPYIGAFGDTMRDTLEIVKLSKKDGLFNPAVLNHDITWNEGTIDGYTLQQAFGDWYFQRSSQTKILQDKCPDPAGRYPCNKSFNKPTAVCPV